MTAPHVPAAFINAIAEEGTKAEAIEWLQTTWNENCALRAQLASARKALEECGTNFATEPGTVMSCATQVQDEFKRRMEIARTALTDDKVNHD